MQNSFQHRIVLRICRNLLRAVCVQVICFIVLLLAGCGSILNSECDDATLQGKGRLSVGIAAAAGGEKEDEYSKRMGILIVDKGFHYSGEAIARYGLNENSDLAACLLYASYPGFGFKAGYKRALMTSSILKTAFYGSVQYFATYDEIPFWEVVKTTYNRQFTNLTLGGVGSIALPNKKTSQFDDQALLSAGAKISLNYADVREVLEYYQSSQMQSIQATQAINSYNYYYLVTPYIVLSIRPVAGATFFAECQWPVVCYNAFTVTSAQGVRLSIGITFQVVNE